MRRQRSQIEIGAIHVKRYLAERLHCVRVKDHSAFAAEPADFFNRLKHARFIVGRHDADQDRAIRECVLSWLKSMKPALPTGREGTRQPIFSRCFQLSRTALCSVTAVTMWLPFSRQLSATPFRARLSLSVAPEVKTISWGSAPMEEAI